MKQSLRHESPEDEDRQQHEHPWGWWQRQDRHERDQEDQSSQNQYMPHPFIYHEEKEMESLKDGLGLLRTNIPDLKFSFNGAHAAVRKRPCQEVSQCNIVCQHFVMFQSRSIQHSTDIRSILQRSWSPTLTDIRANQIVSLRRTSQKIWQFPLVISRPFQPTFVSQAQESSRQVLVPISWMI